VLGFGAPSERSVKVQVVPVIHGLLSTKVEKVATGLTSTMYSSPPTPPSMTAVQVTVVSRPLVNTGNVSISGTGGEEASWVEDTTGLQVEVQAKASRACTL
jgi:hypothetical protein